MAYCKSCGAYIPDGLTACLACGYDETAERAASASKKKAAPKPENNSDMREVMERHRKLQQEKNRQWAEQEKARRDQQQENRRWAREEYAKRQARREVENEQRQQEEQRRRAEEERARQEQKRRAAESGGTTGGTGNTALAALSYLSVLFVLPFLFTPQDEYAKYHARQGLRLFILGAIIDMIGSAIPFGWVLSLFRLYCIFKGMTNALNGRKEPLPYIGTIGKS